MTKVEVLFNKHNMTKDNGFSTAIKLAEQLSTIDDSRELDIQAVCEAILNMSIEQTGDYGDGGKCPLCDTMCNWSASMRDVYHNNNCPYLIAKDLSTNIK